MRSIIDWIAKRIARPLAFVGLAMLAGLSFLCVRVALAELDSSIDAGRSAAMIGACGVRREGESIMPRTFPESPSKRRL